ncbi:uncharacterized protein AB675_4941 [Cyphellophora attinorum]|uniref:Uncharacterized protein n=1 Tax=Cyphellophora attinorum TaxID=1664694 RepID=A0A0N1H2L2_9EURO|nr:uncharacterized protein AB675_4941 [Phialophora attinorum]KPI34620.1 hypothetical protein AB675_4941 [Phialophora attinorum]
MSQTTVKTQEQYPCPLLEQRFSELKQAIIKPEDRDRVSESYARLKDALERESSRIAGLGPKAIPEVDFSIIESNGGQLPPSLVSVVHDTGCVIIRDVVSEAQATAWEAELKAYTKNHPKAYGFPKTNPTTYSLYWTRPQVQIRSHPRVMKAMNAVSRLWHVEDEAGCLFDLDSQVVYADRFRIRRPGLEYTLNAHQDSGAIERWEDPSYRACYQKIFEGKWEDYDAWAADHRSKAKTDLYYTGQSCSAFRSLQGWLSLSHTSPNSGTLRLLPSLKLTTAYQMLRPYFILNESFDNTTPLFPGATPADLQFKPPTPSIRI